MKVHDQGTQTVIVRHRVTLSASPLGRGEIVSVIVHNPLSNADNTPNVLEVLIGDDASQIYDLLPGANTPELFAVDLKDLYARVRVAVGEVEPVDETDIVLIIHRYAEPVRPVKYRK